MHLCLGSGSQLFLSPDPFNPPKESQGAPEYVWGSTAPILRLNIGEVSGRGEGGRRDQ